MQPAGRKGGGENPARAESQRLRTTASHTDGTHVSHVERGWRTAVAGKLERGADVKISDHGLRPQQLPPSFSC